MLHWGVVQDSEACRLCTHLLKVVCDAASLRAILNVLREVSAFSRKRCVSCRSDIAF